MSVQVVIAPLALRQLRDEADWYRDRSRSDDLARDWLDGFMAVLDSLQHDSARHPLARESHRFPVEIYEVHYGSGRRKTHRALYRVQGAVVHVLTIRHIAQEDVGLDSM